MHHKRNNKVPEKVLQEKSYSLFVKELAIADKRRDTNKLVLRDSHKTFGTLPNQALPSKLFSDAMQNMMHNMAVNCEYPLPPSRPTELGSTKRKCSSCGKWKLLGEFSGKLKLRLSSLNPRL